MIFHVVSSEFLSSVDEHMTEYMKPIESPILLLTSDRIYHLLERFRLHSDPGTTRVLL